MKLYATAVLSLSLAAPVCADEGAIGALFSASPAVEATAEAVPAAPAPLREAVRPAARTTPPVAAPVKGSHADVMDLDPYKADILVATAREEGYTVLELSGRSMTTKKAIMAHTAQQLRLPLVPENWDALIDLLSDLPEIHNNKDIMIVVRDADKILRASPQLYADFREVAEFSAKNTRSWSRGGVRLSFIFVK